MMVTCSSASGPLAFEDPLERIVARRREDLPGAFAAIERALGEHRYVAGFLSYELGAEFVPKQPPAPPTGLPLLAIGVFARAASRLAPARGHFSVGALAPGVSQTRYRADVAAILRSIREGDVYQVNYAVPFAFAFSGDPLALFDALTASGDYPHAAYVEDDERAIVSCSPELFVRWEPGRIVTRPMKGTAEPGDFATLANEKNRAEHVMIVDLLRNDLHRLGGDVTVERLLEVETYPTYVTMTSTIATPLRPGLPFGDVMRALFPSGSVTGAPKMTAMQTIARTERRQRGIFCGSIGYLAPDRTGSWNVAIRTAEIDKSHGRGVLHVGGGIVADSNASAEWAEIVTKRRFFESLTPHYALLETLLLQRTGRYRNLEAHLARLARSADALHYRCDLPAVRAALAGVRAESAVIVRLQLEAGGAIAVSRRPYAIARDPVRLCWSHARIDSSEPLLRYKTSWRPIHDQASAVAEELGCFDALLRNERDEVCDGARTTVFVERGATLLTPPLGAGALPGVLRQRLLDAGRAREQRLFASDLESAANLYVGNSARGLVRAVLAAGSARLADVR